VRQSSFCKTAHSSIAPDRWLVRAAPSSTDALPLGCDWPDGRTAAVEHSSARTLIRHYLNIARKHQREHLQRPQVQRKKYFFVLQPLFSALFLHHLLHQAHSADSTGGAAMSPLDFEALLRVVPTVPEGVRDAALLLLRQKRDEHANLSLLVRTRRSGVRFSVYPRRLVCDCRSRR
jgi:hypothetical protein